MGLLRIWDVLAEQSISYRHDNFLYNNDVKRSSSCLFVGQLPPLPPPKISPHEQKHPQDPPPPYHGLSVSPFIIIIDIIFAMTTTSSCMRKNAADNPSPLSCTKRRARPTAWKPRPALSEGFFLALWPGSIRIHRSTGGIFAFPQLVYLPRYSRGGRRGRRLPSPWQHWLSLTVRWSCSRNATMPP